MNEDGETTSATDQWSRIQMTEPGEVNGVRFLAGTVIDAQTHDADKLIFSGKAVRVDEDGNIISDHDHDSNVSEAPLNESDEAAQAFDGDASTQPVSIDENSAPAASDEASMSVNDADGEAQANADPEPKEDQTEINETADENLKEHSS